MKDYIAEMFYKWQNSFVPDPISREVYNEPDLIKIISYETFTDFDECMKAGREQDYSVPHSYDGPYLCILGCKDKQELENVYCKKADTFRIASSIPSPVIGCDVIHD